MPTTTDPLKRNGPDNTRLLFDKLSSVCNGFASEQVSGAAANLLLNAIRQQAATKTAAAVAFDELSARLKGVLMEHYDGVTGRRKSIFPFDQVIEVPKISFRNKF